ncbi:MAG: antibiotic biosynthesis monooxygenase [Bacteroidales bacterium]|nr:antibiotic biosynthesis monooxygenase [Candidatus Cryptobacteroides onthequi]MCQ2165470.1 antibiotic biosynthesis monooxygenase [Bacteroidales bacterium]
MIRINCFFKAKEDKYAEALEYAIALVAESQRQEGCIAYDVFESGTRGDVFMICETWASQELLDAHSASEPFTRLVPQIQECGELKIEVFNF